MKKKILLITSLLAIGLIVTGINYYKINHIEKISIDRFNDLVTISSQESISIPLKNIKVIFILRLSDFHCHSCYSSFRDVYNYISKNNESLIDSTIFIIEKDERNIEAYSLVVNKWKKVNNINCKSHIISSIEITSAIEKSCILINRNDYYEIFQFPVSENKIEYIKKMLLQL